MKIRTHYTHKVQGVEVYFETEKDREDDPPHNKVVPFNVWVIWGDNCKSVPYHFDTEIDARQFVLDTINKLQKNLQAYRQNPPPPEQEWTNL